MHIRGLATHVCLLASVLLFQTTAYAAPEVFWYKRTSSNELNRFTEGTSGSSKLLTGWVNDLAVEKDLGLVYYILGDSASRPNMLINKIHVRSLSSTASITPISTDGGYVQSIALDTKLRKLYWADTLAGKVYRKDLNNLSASRETVLSLPPPLEFTGMSTIGIDVESRNLFLYFHKWFQRAGGPGMVRAGAVITVNLDNFSDAKIMYINDNDDFLIFHDFSYLDGYLYATRSDTILKVNPTTYSTPYTGSVPLVLPTKVAVFETAVPRSSIVKSLSQTLIISSLAVDKVKRKLYWAERLYVTSSSGEEGNIAKSDLDGKNISRILSFSVPNGRTAGYPFPLVAYFAFDPPPVIIPCDRSNQNQLFPADVDADNEVTATDVSKVTNWVNANGGSGPIAPKTNMIPPYVDVDGDCSVTSNDVSKIINYINSQ